LRKLRKLSSIVIQAFSQTALGKRGSPVGEQPVPDGFFINFVLFATFVVIFTRDHRG
jgi:hypothetical protein